VFYRDAFKIIKEHPIFGIGGGGWSSIYFMYQSYLYWTTQTHNYIFQVWIETGTVGLLSLIAVIISLIYAIIKVYKNEHNEGSKTVVVGIAISCFALLSHSFIDFDLSLASLSIFLWTLMGLIDSSFQSFALPEKFNTRKRFHIELPPFLIIGCYILLTVLSTSLFNGYLYGQKAVASVQAKDIESARKYFESAAKYDPFMSSYKADLGSVLNVLGEQQKSKLILDRAMQFAKSAVELDPYNSKILASAAKIYFNQGKIEEGLEYIDRSVKVQPLNPVNYQQKAQAYMAVADYYLKNKNVDRAKQILNQIKQIPSDVEKINKIVMKPVEINDETKKIIQQAEDILKTLQ
jgi:tetratricopeptide (TPR) repeat protein